MLGSAAEVDDTESPVSSVLLTCDFADLEGRIGTVMDINYWALKQNISIGGGRGK